MTCDECRGLLQDLVDGELAADRSAEVEAHLAECPGCAQLRKRLARFGTALRQGVGALRPAADFSSKVLAKYEGSKPALGVVRLGRALDWTAAAGIVALVVLGLTVLLWPRAPQGLGRLAEPGRTDAHVLDFRNGAWQDLGAREVLESGMRVEARGPAGDYAALRFTACEAYLIAPCAAQLEARPQAVWLHVLPEAPGRIRIGTVVEGIPEEQLQTLRVCYGRCWAELSAGPDAPKDAFVIPRPDGRLTVAVTLGFATISNGSVTERVEQGLERTVPQTGECTPAVPADPRSIEWVFR